MPPKPTTDYETLSQQLASQALAPYVPPAPVKPKAPALPPLESLVSEDELDAALQSRRPPRGAAPTPIQVDAGLESALDQQLQARRQKPRYPGPVKAAEWTNAPWFSQVDNVFRKAGISTYAWAHNVQHESRGDPGSVGDGKTSFGLFQLHRGGLYDELVAQKGEKEAKRIAHDPVESAKFVAGVAQRYGVHKAKDPHEQARLFLERVERPRADLRQKRANEIAEQRRQGVNPFSARTATPRPQTPAPQAFPPQGNRLLEAQQAVGLGAPQVNAFDLSRPTAKARNQQDFALSRQAQNTKWKQSTQAFNPFRYDANTPRPKLEQGTRKVGEFLTRTAGQMAKPEQDYLTSNAPAMRLDANPQKRKQQLDEIRQLKPTLDEFSGLAKERYQRAVAAIPPTERQWMELQQAASGPGFVTQQVPPAGGFLSEDEYRKRALAAAVKYLSPLSPQIIPTLERRLGRKLTPAQREALLPLVTAEKLKILNDLDVQGAAIKDVRDFLIGWATGAAVEGVLAKPLAAMAGKASSSVVKGAGKLGRATGVEISPEAAILTEKAAEGMARQGVAKTKAALNTPLGKAATETLSPTKAAGAGAGNVVVQALDDAKDPTLKPEERAKRLGEAFTSGAVLNAGAEAALQGLGGLRRLFPKGRPQGLRGVELAAELDRLSREVPEGHTRTIEVPSRPELGVLEVTGREGDTVVAQAPNGARVKVPVNDVRFTPARPEVPERTPVTIKIEPTPAGEAVPVRITEKGGVKVKGVRPLDFESTSDVVDLYDAYEAGKVADFAREVGEERFERAFDYWEALDKDGITEPTITKFREWLEGQQVAETGRMKAEAQQVATETRQTGRQLVQDAYGGAKDRNGNVLLPDTYTPEQLERIYQTLNTPGRQKRTYATGDSTGMTLRDLVVDARMIPPDALPRGGRKKGEVKVEPRLQMVDPSVPTGNAPPRIGKDNVQRVAEGQQIARGKKALKSRIDFEVRKKALEPDIAEAAHSFLDLLPDKYVEGLGSSYYAGREIPPDLVDGKRGALGYYSPTEAIIGVAKLGANLSKTGERVVPHEVTHHLERFVPEADFKALNRQYLREKKVNLKRLENQAEIATQRAQNAKTAAEKAKWEDRAGELRQQAYRYTAFSEWFADTIVDKAMRDIYPEGSPRALYQRVAENLREVVEAIRQYLIRQGHPDVAEAVYKRFKEGAYSTTRAKRPMGTVDEKLLMKGFDLPKGSGAYRLDLSTGDVEKLDKSAAQGETVRGKIVTLGAANAPDVGPAAPSVTPNVPEKPESSPTGLTPPPTGTKPSAQAQKPAETPTGSTGGDSDRSSLKNRIQAEKVEAGELPRAPEKGRGMGEREATDEGRRLIAEGFDPEQFARDFAEGKEVRLTGPKEAALGIHANKLEAEMKALKARVAVAVKRGDGERARTLQAEYDTKLEGVMDFLDNAQKTKTEASNVFRAIKSELDLDTGNFVAVLSKAEGVSGKKAAEFTPEQRKALEQTSEVSRDIQEKLDAVTAEVETLRQQVETTQAENVELRKQAQQKLDRGKIPMELPGTDAPNLRDAAKRQRRKEALKAEREQIGKELLDLAGKYGARISANPLDPGFYTEAAPLIKRLAHNLYAEGKLTLDDVVEGVRAQFQGHGLDLDPQAIIDAIAEKPVRTPTERKPSIVGEARKRSTAAQEREAVRVKKKTDAETTRRQKQTDAQTARQQVEAAEITSLEEQLRTGNFTPRQPGLKPPTRTQAQERLATLRAAKGRIERKRAAVSGQTVTTQKRKSYSPASAEEAALDAALKANREAATASRRATRQAARDAQKAADAPRKAQQRYEKTIASLEADIAEWKRRLAEGDFAGLEKQQRVVDQRLADLRAEREIARRKVMAAIEATRPKGAGDWFEQVWNAPKTFRASIDISAPGRQGWLLGLAHPGLAAQAFKAQIQAMKSEVAHQQIYDEIMSRPNAREYRKHKLHIAEPGGGLAKGEENYITRIGGVVGKLGVEQSERAYVAYLNRLRADVFDKIVAGLGDNPSEDALRSVAIYVNTATGRGLTHSAPFEGLARGASWIFFSPRFLASRLEYLMGRGVLLSGADPKTRLAIAADYAKTYAAMGTALGLLALAKNEDGSQKFVEKDLRHTDFGKLKVGDQRVDFSAGMSAPMVLSARIAAAVSSGIRQAQGKDTSNDVHAITATGKTSNLRDPKFGGSNVKDLLQDYLGNKWAPTPSTAVYLAQGQGFMGEEYGGLQAARDLFAPMSFANLVQALIEDGMSPEDALYTLDFVGASVSSRKPRDKKAQVAETGGLGVYKPKTGNVDDVEKVFKEVGVRPGEPRKTVKIEGVSKTIPDAAYNQFVEAKGKAMLTLTRRQMQSENWKKARPEQKKAILGVMLKEVDRIERERLYYRLGWK